MNLSVSFEFSGILISGFGAESLDEEDDSLPKPLSATEEGSFCRSSGFKVEFSPFLSYLIRALGILWE